MPPQLPTQQERSAVRTALENVIEALTQHPEWKNPPNQNATLYYVWDFVKRSEYMLSEFENIQAGRPVQHANQFRGGVGSGDSAALKTFQDVCSRTMMLEMIVNDTSGKMAMMTGSTGPALDFGQRVKDAVKALNAACPEEHVMAGMMN